jgi:hypothetical protein
MGITDFFSDVWETFSHPSPDAEAPPQGGSSTESPASGTDEESAEEAEVNKQDAKEEGEGEQGHMPSGAGEDEEEDEEEEEPQDPKDVLEKGELHSTAFFGWDSVSGAPEMRKRAFWMHPDAQSQNGVPKEAP